MAVTPVYNRVLQGDTTTGPWRGKVFQISLTGTYATGGFAVSANDIGIGHTLFGILLLQVITQATAGAGAVYDISYVGGNLVLMTSTGAEIAAGTNMATGVLQLLAWGY